MSIMEYNGGAVIGMKGKNCVAIAADRRFGVQALTLGTDFKKIFSATDRVYYGLAGLATDVQTVSEKLKMKVDMYELREERSVSAKTFAHIISSTLYERRFGPYFVEPVIVGLDGPNKDEPFICSADLIGCLNFAKDFVVIGTAGPQLYGMCESLWEPDLEPEDLFETISQALLNAVDRDAISGWGGIVHVITPEGVVTRTLKGRMD
ncbi:nucleophile aminohydrolase [Zopfochytrium polystomum]|nr:nucleophile aminohydrolase [Zopfochytrium polystomum]